jgi:hypothetical protein
MEYENKKLKGTFVLCNKLILKLNLYSRTFVVSYLLTTFAYIGD